MSAHGIWWERIGSSLTLLDRISDYLRKEESVVLQMPENLPWPRVFYSTAARLVASFSRDRVREMVSWTPGANPGKMLMEEFCSEDEQLGYFPTTTPAAYLAELWDTYLNDCVFWITDIHKKTDMVAWVDFVEEYRRLARERLAKNRERKGQHAVFVLVYDGPALDAERIPCISYRVRKQDIRVFSLETAAELDNSELDDYQAELALSICGKDPELCAALLKTGQQLLTDPVNTAAEVIRTGKRSDGKPFAAINERELTVRVWLAQISRVFPAMERYRYDFIVRHEKTIGAYLPTPGSDGKPVTDPYRLDIGELNHLVGFHRNQFPVDEVEQIVHLRQLRNGLAHIEVAKFEDVKKALE